MDPTANLKRQRELVKIVLHLRDRADGPASAEELADAADELATLAQALDVWITTGGFLPKPWERKEARTA